MVVPKPEVRAESPDVGQRTAPEPTALDARKATILRTVVQEHILTGDGQGSGQPRAQVRVVQEIENQPEGCGDAAGPQTPVGRRLVFIDPIKTIEQESASDDSRQAGRSACGPEIAGAPGRSGDADHAR